MSDKLKITFEKNDVKCVVQEIVGPPPSLLHIRHDGTWYKVFVDGGVLPNGEESEFYPTVLSASQAALEVVTYIE